MHKPSDAVAPPDGMYMTARHHCFHAAAYCYRHTQLPLTTPCYRYFLTWNMGVIPVPPASMAAGCRAGRGVSARTATCGVALVSNAGSTEYRQTGANQSHRVMCLMQVLGSPRGG